MPLSAGDKLGPYEILAPIGTGGMGAVYRAHDSRLGRDVAIKISTERFTERFEKEARAIAALNHVNVCTLHDVGPNYLVMELVEGRTLSERIKQGAIPWDEALAIAKQIAAALEAAHEKGITHRDLKPGNISLKPDGTLKVLDFGLAKLDVGQAVQTEDSPTFTMGTQAGVILGTAPYMAPERARGKVVDRRVDIWAFGVVLYEMLTARKLFRGEDVSEVLASVIKEEPKLDRAPAKVQRLLRSCLEKDPTQRLQAIGDWRLLLDGEAPVEAHVGTLPWIFAAVPTMVAAIAFWAPWRMEKQPDRPLVRLDVDLGSDVSLPGAGGIAISPDGTTLAYRTGGRLFIRRLDQVTATELAATPGGSTLFFSPDGRSIGFHDGRLNKISVAGGTVVPLADVAGPNFDGASWAEDGSIFLSTAFQGGLLRIPTGGGLAETIAGLGAGELSLDGPQVLPGGKAVLFSVDRAQGEDRNTIEVLTLADRRRKIVARGGSISRYLPTSSGVGHLLYLNKGTLFAIPFDLAKLEAHGTAVPVLDDVRNANFGISPFDFSSAPSGHGTLVYRKAGGVEGLATLQWVDSNGKIEPLRLKPGLYSRPILSPDGKRVTLSISEGGISDVWVYDIQRDAMTRLTFGGGSYRWSTFSPDGKYVVFTSDGHALFQARADGSGQPQPLTEGKPFQFPHSFTPDGKRLAYFETAGTYQLWTVPVEDLGDHLKAGKPEQFLQSTFNDTFPEFSPDGRWLAYQSNESGKPEVYVRAFPPPSSGQGGKWQISNGGEPVCFGRGTDTICSIDPAVKSWPRATR
jgi:WD40 repeat protein/predicted Ser/Thr protein kinase